MSNLTSSDTIRLMHPDSLTLPTATTENDRVRVNLLKGVAIIAVICIHILSSIPGHIYTTDHAAPYIFLDQLFRFSVPLFIGLSGYALARRYGSHLHIRSFYQRRLSRLVPLYLLWSIGLWLLFRAIPVWNTADEFIPLWKVLFLGRADYHLYFVPLILQLYVLFPFLLKLLNRFPRTTLFGAVVVQSLSFIFFNYVGTLPEKVFLATDQEQYSLFTSWIFYFVLGIFIAKRSWPAEIKIRVTAFCWLTWGLSLAYLVLYSQLQILNQIDPLDALKFTRLHVLPYTMSSICLALLVPWETFSHPSQLSKIVGLIGRYSFSIYLAHTLVLRLFFANTFSSLSFSDMLVTAVFVIVAINLSYWYEKNP